MASVKQERVETPLRRFKSGLPEPVKRGMRDAARSYGRATAGLRTHPDFLVIGTKRGGTTSLWNALIRHQDVLPLFPGLQEIKSPHYFDINYWRGDSWYRSFFPTAAQREHHRRVSGATPLAGEASPYYMFHPLAAERIAADLPDVRLVVSLRNPVDRAWSHYNERVAGHTEYLSFADALAAEEARTRGEERRLRSRGPNYYSYHHDLSTYLARGRYWEHLRRYFDCFDASRILLLKAEDFYSHPMGELEALAGFLDLDVAGFGEVAHYNRIPRDTLTPDVRARLEDYYRESVAELEGAVGRRFGWFD